MITLNHGEYYWLKAPAIDPDDISPVIGQFSRAIRGTDKWYVGGKFYNAGLGIDVIKHIPMPKV